MYKKYRIINQMHLPFYQIYQTRLIKVWCCTAVLPIIAEYVFVLRTTLIKTLIDYQQDIGCLVLVEDFEVLCKVSLKTKTWSTFHSKLWPIFLIHLPYYRTFNVLIGYMIKVFLPQVLYQKVFINIVIDNSNVV